MRRGNNTKVYRKHIHKEDDDYWNKNLHEEAKKSNQKYSKKKSKSNLNKRSNNNYDKQINEDYNNYTEEELSKDILKDLSEDNNQNYQNYDNEKYYDNENYEDINRINYDSNNIYSDYDDLDKNYNKPNYDDLNRNSYNESNYDDYNNNQEDSKYQDDSINEFKPIFFKEENLNPQEVNHVDINLLNQDKLNKLNNLKNKKAFSDIIDLRIIVNNSQNAEYLNLICKNIDFSQFNINLSAIIQTDNLNIAKIASFGADIIIIAEGEDKKLYNQFYNELKTDDNYIEAFSILDNNVNIKYLESKLNKTIIKVGLNSILNINHFKSIKNDLDLLNIHYDEIKSVNDKLKSENLELNNKLSKLESDNDKLNSDINNLQKINDELKSEIADFKTRYSNIHTKKILEIFSLSQLWSDTFNEDLNDEEKIVIATNEFKPENIIIGQGFIGARSVDEAIDWLRVVRTALIFVNLRNN
ncbi:hypothetical protein BGI41_03430 [Methanobrevibacter sp. 87.7]|uniref:hypothetical protein n=1 Tax=Methanobrevibacter sp. 87.7 TaxID=387957 RepID=UPI000B50089D|nr:hypothetical protein [Methanobrevibacter sp. 87.7]OWT33244.1 hypothetical protein BGI41_03430 [Methanobrevibacter sp. 87.7]